MVAEIVANALERAHHILHNLASMLHQDIVAEGIGIALEMRAYRLVCAVVKIDAARIEVCGKMPVVRSIRRVAEEPVRPMASNGVWVAAGNRPFRRNLDFFP